jgi:alanine-synthesizing transaminase
LEFTNRAGNHRYAVSRGVRKLREAFSTLYRRNFDVGLDPDSEVCVCFGSKEAFLHLLISDTTRTNKILVGTPTYPAYISAAEILGIQVDTFTIQSDLEAMQTEIKSKLRDGSYNYLVLNFPNNPTGVVVNNDFYKSVINEARRQDTRVVNDFVYGELQYDSAATSSLAALGCEGVVEIYSLSKSYSVPGWRVAAALGDPEIVKKLAEFKSKTDYGLFLPLQLAAAHVLSQPGDLPGIARSAYSRRAKLASEVLLGLGFEIEAPQAGCSLWCKLPKSAGSGIDFAKKMLIERQIVVLPGAAFGNTFDDYVRIALVCSEVKLNQVLDSMCEFFS